MEPEIAKKSGSDASPANPRLFKRFKLFLALVAIGVICAVLGFVIHTTDHAKRRAKVAKVDVQDVQVVFPEKPPTVQLTLPGHTHPFYQAPIYAQTTGYLKKWYYDIGAKVKAGDILAEIDTPEVDQQLSQAQASLATAQAQSALDTNNFNEAKRLLETNVDSKRDFETMQSKYLAQQSVVNSFTAALQRLQALEDFKLLRAPFDGVVTVRNTDIGDLVVTGSNHILFQVAQENPLRVYVQVPEAFAKEIQPSTKAELSFDELPSRLFPATVVATAHAVDPSNRAQLTELQVSNATNELWPGAYTRVHFHVNNSLGGLFIPSNTLIFQREGPQVGVVTEHGQVALHQIQIAQDLGGELEIAKGLSATDQVIVNPSDSLSEGMKIHVVGHIQNKVSVDGN
ncbi:MAG: efflux RND transporter periplasmic adaptor subunit [Verrucomicrobia bacterium]|nr:efflux RND transporter periplasmic adaptor subunit [Verrucomicrobiota bacterium]